MAGLKRLLVVVPAPEYIPLPPVLLFTEAEVSWKEAALPHIAGNGASKISGVFFNWIVVKASLKQLSADIIYLTMEKDPNRRSFLAGKLQLIAVVFLVAILSIGLLLFFMRKKENYAEPGIEKK